MLLAVVSYATLIMFDCHTQWKKTVDFSISQQMVKT